MMGYLVSALVDDDAPTDGYSFDLPAVRALDALQFDAVTVLVGDNGTGKSTLVEAIAVAAGFNAEGGSRNLQFATFATHSELADRLTLRWDRRPRWGWFLRAETFYGMATTIESDEYLRPHFPDLHRRSHGESFLELIDSRMTTDGFYVLDEPESALSFVGQLHLLAAIGEACRSGAQFLIATHSPLLMAVPGARIYELDEHGATPVAYDDVAAVGLWRNFLDAPDRFLRHLFDGRNTG